MATEYVDLSNDENNFTKIKNDDTIKADTPLKSVAYNVIKNLQAQKLNTESDYKVDNLYFKKSETSDINPPLLINKGNLPKEKLEIERLKKITGEYNLKNADPVKIDESMRLKNKTPDDYYHYTGDINEEKKRIDEVFGPKTDFSISNFENNYDKFNQEEQEMITHKMQLELNSQGYTDSDGYKLKPDGIYGDKTKGAYEKYKKNNPEDYKDAVGNKETFNTSNLLYSVTSDEKPQVTYASSTKEIKNNQQEYNYDSDSELNKNIRLTNYNNNNKDRDKEVLTKEDYKKVKIFKSVYNYAKDILKDDVIADSSHREAVAVRRQDKYSKYEDYGPKRLKNYKPSNKPQYVSVIGYLDNDYEYSDTNDTASILISKPLTESDVQWITGSILGMFSNAGVFQGELVHWNVYAGIADWILSKTNPLYNKISAGDVVITVRKHKGGYKGAWQKEYKFYYDTRNEEIYYME